MSIWVLTREENQYDQYGEYFDHAWHKKPTLDILRKRMPNEDNELLLHILNGGGRTDKLEDTWYHLNEVSGS